MVNDYRIAREASMVAIEEETAGDHVMARENGMVGLTFKEWLLGNASSGRYSDGHED
jgi:hypothetical protein